MAGSNEAESLALQVWGSNEAAQLQAARRLYDLGCRSEEDVAAIVAAGGIPGLLHLFSNSSGEEGTQAAARTLACLAGAEDGAAALSDSAPNLVNCLGSRKPGKLRQSAAELLDIMVAEHPQGVEDAIRAGVVPALLSLLGRPSSSDSAAEQQAAAAVLYHMVQSDLDSDAVCAAIAAAGGIPVLARCLHSSGSMMQVLASATLSYVVSENPQRLEEAAAAGAIPRLVQLVHGQATGSAGEAAIALCGFACGPDSVRGQVLAAGGIPALLRLLLNNQVKEGFKPFITNALGRMAVHDAGMRAAIVAAGGRAALQQLSASSSFSQETRSAAAAALQALGTANAASA